MAAAVTHREIVTFQVQDEGSGKVRNITANISNYRGEKQKTVAVEKTHQTQLKKSIPITENVMVSQRAMTRNLHMMNMAALGINMSLLGLSWNLQRTGMFSDEAIEKITNVIAPIQMVASVINLGSSAWQMYNIMRSMATVQHVIGSKAIISSNLATSASFINLRMRILAAMFALAGMAAIFGAFMTNSMAARVALGALGGAMLVYAAKTMIATLWNYAFQSSIPVIGWIAMAAGAALLVATIAAITGAISGASLWKGGIINRRTTTMGELGPEAVIPLSSSRGRRALRDMGGGGGMSVQNMYVSVHADRPATTYRNLNDSIRREAYLS
jgi:hypothetical protein